MRFETGVHVDAPAQRVWQVMTDVAAWPEFTPTMTEVRPLDGGPLAVGARVRIKQPKIPPLVWTVTELTPYRSFTWAATTGGVRITAGHVLDGDTTVTLSIEQSGLLSPLLALFTAGRTRAYVRTEAESLKRRCET
ncbi:polyketide cyclase [Nonomuraea sp. NN258]|nr:polyketide cyclase [Nonomuraea antri]